MSSDWWASRLAEVARKRALVDDCNAVVDALNLLLADDPLPHVEVTWREPPTELMVSLNQLRRLLDLLGEEVPR